MDQLRFYHLEKTSAATPPQDTVLFETCLRKIYFFNGEPAEVSPDLELYEGAKAFLFLSEVLCGLKSKVLGETEIFGQFRKFLETPEAKTISSLQRNENVRFLFETVKAARDQHIKNWGVQSYGSMIRKIAKPYNEISLIGFGVLGQQLLPWLKKKSVTVHVRRPEAVMEVTHAQIRDLAEGGFAALTIVAAPVSSEFLLQAKGSVETFVDCRALSPELTSLQGSANVIELKDLFANLENEYKNVLLKLPEVQEFLLRRVDEFSQRTSHRPLGWEDLCA